MTGEKYSFPLDAKVYFSPVTGRLRAMGLDGTPTLARRISDDHPSSVAILRVVRRTIFRSRSRVELWNGNIEPGLWHAIANREGIIRWAMKHQRTYRRTVPITERGHPHLQVVRLRSQREVEAWLAGALAAAN